MLPRGVSYAFCILFLIQCSLAWQNSSVCKALPGDDAWPSESLWNAFNTSVDGRLIRTVPIGSPCHEPSFDQDKCDFVRSNWHLASLHLSSSSSMMNPLWANRSCDPFTAPTDQCVIGTYVQYAVNVSTVAHVAKTLAFAKTHNIRFVVRNTAHDFMGKSTGTGGLAIWTRFLQETTWIDEFSSSIYQGPAIKGQAGVFISQMYAAANEKNHVIVAGNCGDVGFAGGFIQGAGYALLGSIHGMAADSALKFEVITTQGQLVTASPDQHPDLYWALAGGGGGTYGIVWSVTVKAHPNFPVTIANLTINATTVAEDVFWEGIASYQSITPNLTDAGAYAFAFYRSEYFQLAPLFVPNKSVAEVNALLDPLFTTLNALGINYTSFVYGEPSFQTAYDSVPLYSNFHVGDTNSGGRILPRSLFQDQSSFSKMMNVIRGVVDGGGHVYDTSINPSFQVTGNPPSLNAVLPAWRYAQKFLLLALPWNDTATAADIIATRNKITTILDPPLRELAPDSGAYLNEADAQEPDWQHSFYGSNYPRLLAIKDKWDPDQLLYGATAVGGDRWAEDEEGRLCKV